jgi:hypothetical protein
MGRAGHIEWQLDATCRKRNADAERKLQINAKTMTRLGVASLLLFSAGLLTSAADLVAGTVRLDAEKNKVKAERDALARPLSGALGRVAQTDQTGRGLVPRCPSPSSPASSS